MKRPLNILGNTVRCTFVEFEDSLVTIHNLSEASPERSSQDQWWNTAIFYVLGNTQHPFVAKLGVKPDGVER